MSGKPASSTPRPAEEAFRLGINYWPARTAMGFWRNFNPAELAADFARIAAIGFDSVRIFLTWEDFQPTPREIDPAMVGHLVATLDQAEQAGLGVMPTLYTGHMSGVNWIPPWALNHEGGEGGDRRFRVVSEARVSARGLRNWYTDSSTFEAQVRLARELAGALSGHKALLAWDLGNENSNCVVPPDKQHARAWLARVTEAIRAADSGAQITIGLHMEDLEEDRNLGPREAAEVCDFLTMHGYPGYASWLNSPTDERLLPFLCEVTQWLGSGAKVLFSEFGVPTSLRAGSNDVRAEVASGGPSLVEEHEAASYIARALDALHGCGSTGAMLWCHADYQETLWPEPPFDLAHHERSFGLWRADHTAKPALAVVRAFADRQPQVQVGRPSSEAPAFVDTDPDDFYLAPGRELPRLFRRYCGTT